jgi:dolichol-phosphate mannosyltransferase
MSMSNSSASPAPSPLLSIVVPAKNEEKNVAPLIDEVDKAIRARGIDVELIFVVDGPEDQTLERLKEQAATRAWVRLLFRPRSKGQSAAMYAGIQAARAPYIATLDADLQNDPADLPGLLEKVQSGAADMAQGLRAKRQDTLVRKVTSWVGRTARKLILGDDIRDTGCTTRVVKASIAKQFPLQFKGMHRFMPVYARMVGARVIEVPVNHRERFSGVAHYKILDRAFVGLVDCLAMRWMIKRYQDPTVSDVSPLPVSQEPASK